MNVFVTASNSYYQQVRDYLVGSAKKCGGFDKVLCYDVDSMIDEGFRRKNAEILSEKRGAGLWLWKVYFIEKAFREECKEGDFLFYCDAASYFFRSAKPMLDSIMQDVFAVNVPYKEEEYTKKEAFDILDLHGDIYEKTRQFHASFMGFKKNPLTETFINEWFTLCQNKEILCDMMDKTEQKSNFIDHRFDQSIFSLLCKKYKIIPSPDPSQWGINPYPPIKGATYMPIKRGEVPEGYFCIMLHKGRNISLGIRIKLWLVFIKRYFEGKFNESSHE